MNDPRWSDFFELIEQTMMRFAKGVLWAITAAIVILVLGLAIMWMVSTKAFAAGGHYDNDIDGKTVLFDKQGPCANGSFEVKALTKQGNVRHVGCWIVYNQRSVIILWTGGPATVVPAGNITWVSDDDELPKASEV